MQCDEALASLRCMRSAVVSVSERMRESGLQFTELGRLCGPADLTANAGSDGVHLSQTTQQRVFVDVLGRAIASWPQGDPKPVRQLKAPNSRWTRRQKRRRHNLRRRAMKRVAGMSDGPRQQLMERHCRPRR